MDGNEALVRAYGVREVGAGILSLAADKQAGLWSRVAGDALDIATLATALGPRNRKQNNVGFAMAMVIGITVIDIVAAQGTTVAHRRGNQTPRLYHDRSGFPQGVEKARGAARDAATA